MIKRIAIVGPGVMGTLILSKLINSGKYLAKDLSVSGPHLQEIKGYCLENGISCSTDNGEFAGTADLVILAVKPQKFSQAVKPMMGKLRKETVILSIAAGISCEMIKENLGIEGIIRAMPNTPARIGEGITVWYKTGSVTEELTKDIEGILELLGKQVFVEDESYLDMATALSGTGPAYVFLFMEALIDAGVHMGFPRRIAEQLVVQTLKGSTDYYESNMEHPAKLRNQVTSPGGTSAEALYYLDKAGFRTAISRAVWAAYERSVTLGKNLSDKIKEIRRIEE
jgi:pyrroline-5-carboxylate reductase